MKYILKIRYLNYSKEILNKQSIVEQRWIIDHFEINYKYSRLKNFKPRLSSKPQLERNWRNFITSFNVKEIKIFEQNKQFC